MTISKNIMKKTRYHTSLKLNIMKIEIKKHKMYLYIAREQNSISRLIDTLDVSSKVIGCLYLFGITRPSTLRIAESQLEIPG